MLLKTNIHPFVSDLLEFMQIVKNMQSVADLLGWDQETYMPSGAVETRAGQIAAINEIIHEKFLSKKASEIYERIQSNNLNLNYEEKRLCDLFLIEHNKAVKVPVVLVRALSRAKSVSLDKWKTARIDSDFSVFEPHLDELIRLKTEEAKCLNYNSNVYNTLLHFFEPNLQADDLVDLFNHLTGETLRLLDKVIGSGIIIDSDFLTGDFPIDNQMKFARFLAEKSSFDFTHGRLDRSVHPLTDSITAKDVRITIKTEKEDLRPCLFSSLHEIGHGLYEQGIDYTYIGTFAGEGASYSMHESQSLLWEKYLGQSEEFCRWAVNELNMYFPRNFWGITHNDLFKAVNNIQPSYYRIEADKLTYNLHIILRFEIEYDLFNGRIKAKDIPGIWNGKMRKYLGLRPNDDSQGCLQDIHWAAGYFGYFPTYALGMLQAAMLWKTMRNEIPGFSECISAGNFNQLRIWLKDKIHYHGKMYEPDELLKSIVGKPISTDDYIENIEQTIDRIYF